MSGASAWTNIAGATTATYVPTQTDVGGYLQVQVSVTNKQAISTVALLLRRTSGVGRTGKLRRSDGQWNPSPRVGSDHDRWNLEPGRHDIRRPMAALGVGGTWTNIIGATGTTYTLQAADVGATVRAQITAANAYGHASSTSQATGTVGSGAPVSTTAPVITGTPARGSVLTASTGTWAPAGTTYIYQWQRSSSGSAWTNISGATGSTYTEQAAGRGLDRRGQQLCLPVGALRQDRRELCCAQGRDVSLVHGPGRG